MSLKETIETEYKNALKSKDKIKISTYRLILSSIKDLDLEAHIKKSIKNPVITKRIKSALGAFKMLIIKFEMYFMLDLVIFLQSRLLDHRQLPFHRSLR